MVFTPYCIFCFFLIMYSRVGLKLLEGLYAHIYGVRIRISTCSKTSKTRKKWAIKHFLMFRQRLQKITVLAYCVSLLHCLCLFPEIYRKLAKNVSIFNAIEY